MCVYTHIYIYIEREREIDTYCLGAARRPTGAAPCTGRCPPRRPRAPAAPPVVVIMIIIIIIIVIIMIIVIRLVIIIIIIVVIIIVVVVVMIIIRIVIVVIIRRMVMVIVVVVVVVVVVVGVVVVVVMVMVIVIVIASAEPRTGARPSRRIGSPRVRASQIELRIMIESKTLNSRFLLRGLAAQRTTSNHEGFSRNRSSVCSASVFLESSQRSSEMCI